MNNFASYEAYRYKGGGHLIEELKPRPEPFGGGVKSWTPKKEGIVVNSLGKKATVAKHQK